MSFSLEGVPSYAKDAWTVQVWIAHSFVVPSSLTYVISVYNR